MDAILEALFDIAGRWLFRRIIMPPFYWSGWLVLRLLTLGRYPPPQSVPHNRLAVALFAFMLAMFCLIAAYGP